MTPLVILVSFLTLTYGGIIPKDISQYVEGETRIVWLSDDDGHLIKVDLQEDVEDTVLTSRSGANNQYWLFTRQNPNSAQILEDGNEVSVLNSNYRADRPTKFIVHGWTSNGNSNVNGVVREAFLAVQDCNIIVVDWRLAASGNYISSVRLVPTVGQYLGNFVDWLVNFTGGDWNKFHLIGYSLGAHVVGEAGRQVGGKVGRVTGLDPAGPLWQTNSNRISSASGQYVEGIHTDGLLQGILSPIGHADFYPNGGSNQPGCSDSACSHARSYRYFAASVLEDRFVGRQCSSLLQATNMECAGATFNMGNGITTKQGSGLYELSTGSAWPF